VYEEDHMAQNQTVTNDVERRVEDWVVRPLQETQRAIAKGTEWWLELTRPFIPGAGDGPSSKQLNDLVDQTFDCAARMLEVQRDFTKVLLALLEGVEDRAEARRRAKGTAA
jgi:hypothetical protein